jgi:HlyD family secretion protein
MNRIVLISILVALTIAAFWGIGRLGSPTIEYLTATVERGKLRTTVTATGTVNALTSVEVGSQLSGQIHTLMADYNSPVKTGQPLARLDPQAYEASVSEARAALEVARANVLVRKSLVDRARSALASAEAKISVVEAKLLGADATLTEAQQSLSRKQTVLRTGAGSVSRETVDQAEAKLARAKAGKQAAVGEQAVHHQTIQMAHADLRKAEAELLNAEARIPESEASLALAEVNLERTIIRSPIDGVVIARNVSKGQTVAASLEAPKLFIVAQDLHHMEVHANIDEADIGKIRSGQRAVFSVDAYPDITFEGEVVQVRKSPVVVQNVITYTVIIATHNTDLLLFPGMTTTVEVIVFESEEVLKVPASALRYTPSGEIDSKITLQTGDRTAQDQEGQVWLLDDNDKLRSIPVRIGISDAAVSGLLSGDIKAGDRVVVNEISSEINQGWFELRFGF